MSRPDLCRFLTTGPMQTTSAPDNITPMMAQFLEIKQANPGYLLFYRMGDFYELFFEDAVVASGILDIALTRRGKHQGQDIPMCGVPVHAAEAYLERLIRAQVKVAICEQIEDPAEAKKRGSKSVVRRAVVRLVTAGTLTEDSLLEARSNQWLCALAMPRSGVDFALAAADLSTGAVTVEPVSPKRLSTSLAQLLPAEILVADRSGDEATVRQALDDAGMTCLITLVPTQKFDTANAERQLLSAFKVATLDGFGSFSRAEISALGALLDYIGLTQKGALPCLMPPRRILADDAMAIDGPTRRNLELTQTLSGERAGSLLATIDHTITGAGARALRGQLAAPLTNPDAIARRLEMVDFFCQFPDRRSALRLALKQVPDMERALMRLSLDRGSPRDLAALRDGLGQAGRLPEMVGGTSDLVQVPDGIAKALEGMGRDAALVDHLAQALVAEPPALIRDGGFIAPGYHAGLDELRVLAEEGRRVLARLERELKDSTQIASLKIRHNNILGYHIEVTAAHADKLMAPPFKESFIHRQTMAGAVRFTTAALSDLASRIERAGEQMLALEKDLFAELCKSALAAGPSILITAQAIAGLDVAAGLADVSIAYNWVRPKVDRSLAFRIIAGRHPVVEAVLRRQAGHVFVANDCDLTGQGADAKPLWLLTGPNMAGKSTFLRQNALIAILAQIGSHVPAQDAHIGIVDRLFSRVGAADDLARGRSTFMVEMVETAAILTQAGPRALVILDEIGRGTATFDGLSIAWSVVEHLHDINGCRALFATHYHELTALSARLSRLANHTMRVRDWNGEVVFLHEVAKGTADRSYGIHVAQLAGLPPAVIARATQVLDALETGDSARRSATLVDELPLFAASAPKQQSPTPGPSLIEAGLRALDPDALSPREALDALYNLRKLLD
jgi:DNA mismatch repair protein MutS